MWKFLIVGLHLLLYFKGIATAICNLTCNYFVECVYSSPNYLCWLILIQPGAIVKCHLWL